MQFVPKNLLASIGAAALVLAPLTVTTASVALISADAAYAKGNGNGGGGGGGGGRGAEKSERGNSERGNRGGQAGSNGNRSSNTAVRANRGGQSATSQGQSRRAATEQRGNGRPAHAGGNGAGRGAGKGNASVQEAKASGMHPSQLGNMNGALNANMNAVLAHIRNGNTNGPVGHLAALAVADAGAEAAREYLGSPLAGEYRALQDALAAAGYDSLADYDAAVAADPANAIAEVDAARDGIGQSALDDALAEAGYATLADYEAAVTEDAGAADPAIDAALAGLGEVDETTFDAIAEAEADLEALADAEQAMLDYWNKNGDSDPDTITAEEQALLDALHARLDASSEEIAEAIASTKTAEAEVDEAEEGIEDPLPLILIE